MTRIEDGGGIMRNAHRPVVSRRGFCLCCLASTTYAATGGWLTPKQAFAEARNVVDSMRGEAANAPVTVHKLRGNVSALVGSGGNIAVLTGRDGKILVDAGITASRSKIMGALANLGGEPITHLVNTHWHFDHADGNEWLRGQGAIIVAHENTRKHLSEATRVEDWDFNFPPSPPSAIPSEVVTADRTMKLGGSTFELKHYGPAHTDGDLSVRFSEADVIHAGDIYWKSYPFIDYSTGGNIDGTIRAAEAILASATDQTIIVPGHGHPSSGRSELKDYRDMLVAVREKVATLKRQGRTVDEVLTAKPTATFDAIWGQFVMGPAQFTKLVYAGV
jgi:glyoxylase-like metal-dependent hydrolase (beta-lactamase superfamily II)